jgi:protein involved in polysaccharide export with SLBB domain
MPAMKHYPFFTLFFLLMGGLCFAQSSTSSGQAGSILGGTIQAQQSSIPAPSFADGDLTAITKRVLSTRYRLTPGDIYQLLITMGGFITYEIPLQENYELDVPYVGTINVKGWYFSDLRKNVSEKLKKLLPLAEFVTVLFQSPALFDVEIYGSVQSPGTVTMNSLSRVSDAVTMAKGVRNGGSFRRIQLLRADQLIIADLPRYGSGAGEDMNPTLQPGDRIFVPTADVRATISGMINAPGLYELLPGETLQSLISFSGGILPEASGVPITITRFNRDGTTSMIPVDISKAADTHLQNGDQVRIPSMSENRDTILVTGAVFGAPVTADKPVPIPQTPVSINVPYIPGITLLSVLQSLGGPTPYAQADHSVIIRYAGGQRIQVDAGALWHTKSHAMDIPLEAGDKVTIPLVNSVFVIGEVRSPGRVTYSPGLTVKDYIAAAGGVALDSGDANAISLVDEKGVKTKTALDQSVQPGAVIFVDKQWWLQTSALFSNIYIFTTFVTTLLALYVTYVTYIKPLIP